RLRIHDRSDAAHAEYAFGLDRLLAVQSGETDNHLSRTDVDAGLGRSTSHFARDSPALAPSRSALLPPFRSCPNGKRLWEGPPKLARQNSKSFQTAEPAFRRVAGSDRSRRLVPGSDVDRRGPDADPDSIR